MKIIVLDTNSERLAEYSEVLGSHVNVVPFQSTVAATAIINLFADQHDWVIAEWSDSSVEDGVGYLLAACIRKGVPAMVRSDWRENRHLTDTVLGTVEKIAKRDVNESDIRVCGITGSRRFPTDGVIKDIVDFVGTRGAKGIEFE